MHFLPVVTPKPSSSNSSAFLLRCCLLQHLFDSRLDLLHSWATSPTGKLLFSPSEIIFLIWFGITFKCNALLVEFLVNLAYMLDYFYVFFCFNNWSRNWIKTIFYPTCWCPHHPIIWSGIYSLFDLFSLLHVSLLWIDLNLGFLYEHYDVDVK